MTTTPETTDRNDSRSTERPNPNFIDNDLDHVPDTTFRDYDLDERVVDALEAQGITHPFPIQELTLPVALTGQDIIGQARTGTGKTLGFGLPMIERLDKDADHTQALIVTPTRELCIQVHDQLKICEAVGLTSTTVYGGVGYDEQIEALSGGVDIVVGTPGRLLDMLGRGILDLSRVSTVILDEADEMLDMGFLPDVERLLDAANPDGDRHTMLFSATMPASVVKLARRYTDSPLFMGADSVEHETAPTVEQHFLQVFRMDKPRVLARILQQPDRGNAYVFTRTKAMADRLVRELGDLGVDAIAIHGDLRQASREKNLSKFRDGRTSVLCATEVAARGIDVDNVTHVFNYDIPDDEKMYLHRIGRTARAGNRGVAVTFAEHNELARLTMIQKAVQQEDMDELVTHEVFSTSDLLTELFDLPEQTPWDHMAESTGGGSRSGGSRSGGSRSGGDDRSRRSSSRSRQSGRSRSRDRVEHDSGATDDGRDRQRSRTVVRDDAGDRDDRRGGHEQGDGDGRSDGSRSSQTRSRARTRSGPGSSDGRSGGGERSRQRGSSSTDDTATSGSSGTTRTTGGARVRARGGKPVDGRDGAAETTGGDDRSRSRARSRGGDGGSRRGGRSSQGGGSGSTGGDRDRSSGRDSSGRSRSSGGRSRGKGGGNRSSSQRTGGSRSGGNAGGSREGRVDLPSKVRPTTAGSAARGEGQPRHDRSVRVEDLA